LLTHYFEEYIFIPCQIYNFLLKKKKKKTPLFA